MEVLENESRTRILKEFEIVRSTTMNLVKTLEADDYPVQTAPYTSPPKWHIGHTSWIYETVMSKINTEYEFYSKEYSKYLNSYYQQFGMPHDKSKRGIISRPTTKQIFEYAEIVNGRVREFISSCSIDAKTLRLLETGLHHECQHQELLVYDLQHMLADKYNPVQKNEPPKSRQVDAQKTVRIEGGLYRMGHNGEGFCYDVEMPEHKTYLEEYLIDVFPVTCGQYEEFIKDGGYEDYKYWLADGWSKVNENKWECPMYWTRSDGEWFVHDFAGMRPIDPKEPVCNVSYYEASAYCKWAGKRLPTEAEWEKAATYDTDNKREYPWGLEKPDSSKANLLESHIWKPSRIGSYPDSSSPLGCEQMIGDVWEWTSSEFTGYPGFKSGFDEYNDKWFTNQKVLRGGSFATPSMSIRCICLQLERDGCLQDRSMRQDSYFLMQSAFVITPHVLSQAI